VQSSIGTGRQRIRNRFEPLVHVLIHEQPPTIVSLGLPGDQAEVVEIPRLFQHPVTMLQTDPMVDGLPPAPKSMP